MEPRVWEWWLEGRRAMNAMEWIPVEVEMDETLVYLHVVSPQNV
jgi:hypothetical protein